MGQILRNEPLTVIGNGMQTRCFTYIDDAIKATVAAGLLKEAEGEIFNIGNNKETTIKELAEKMIEVSRVKNSIRHVTKEEVYGESYEDIQRRVPNTDRMNNILKVDAETSLEDGLRITIEWFKAIGNKY